MHAGDWVDVALLDRFEARSRRLVGGVRQQRPRAAPRAAARGGARRDRGHPVRRRPRDRRREGPRGALRRPVPRHRRARVRPQPHPVGHDRADRAAAAQPRLADRPPSPAARHLRDRGRPTAARCATSPSTPSRRARERARRSPAARSALLACPVCGGAARRASTTAPALRCAAGHPFDRARQGHVTLLPPGHRPPSGDSAEMVADRVAFLEAGHYAGVTRGAGRRGRADGPAPGTLLDLGGGTGHHLAGVLDRAARRGRRRPGLLALRRAPGGAGPPAGGGRGRRQLGPAAGRGTASSTGCWSSSRRATARRSPACCGRTAGWSS